MPINATTTPATRKVADSPIHETMNYDMFTLMDGNRNIDPMHVKKLKKLMTENGNLTPEMPVLVNSVNEIIDGQHRFTALRELGWPVYYQVRHNMSLSNVRAINVGNKNWTWYDFAASFAKLGNVNYQRFVILADAYPQYGYGVIGRYAGFKDVRSNLGSTGRHFRQGELQFTAEQLQKAKERLAMWVEASERLPKPTSTVAEAFYTVLKTPDYDHNRMLDKLNRYGNQIFNKKWVNLTINDSLRAFEEVYNFNRKDGLEVRFY